MMEGGPAAKIMGIVAGATLALVFNPPRSRSGFVRRTIAAFVAGYVFGHLVLFLTGFEETYDNVVAAFCTAAFLSWSGMGAIQKGFEIWAGKLIKEE